MRLLAALVLLVSAAHGAAVSMAGLHVQGNALVNGGVGVLIHVRHLLGAFCSLTALLRASTTRAPSMHARKVCRPP